VIGIKYTSTEVKKTKVLIQFGESKYQYNIKSADKFQFFPFQLGNGEYQIGVYENIEGTKYAPIAQEKVTIKLDDATKVFLNSIQLIDWSDKMNTVILAKELTKNKTTDKEKIEVCYEYMVRQFKYDFDKLNNLQYDYIPTVDDVVKKKLGICYDYSAVFASMLRSLDIKSKLVMGYTPNVKEYHAWNEVMVDGNWVTVDTTYDSQMYAANIKYTFEKPKSDYSTTYEY
jgi:transglutaminase-like putative cysteine protease